MLRQLILVAILALSGCQCPRWINGTVRVRDAETGRPIEGAVVAVHPGTYMFAWPFCIRTNFGATDANGTVQMRVPRDRKWLYVEAVGYEGIEEPFVGAELSRDEAAVRQAGKSSLEVRLTPLAKPFRVLRLVERYSGPVYAGVDYQGQRVFVLDSDGDLLPTFVQATIRPTKTRGLFKAYSRSWMQGHYIAVATTKRRFDAMRSEEWWWIDPAKAKTLADELPLAPVVEIRAERSQLE